MDDMVVNRRLGGGLYYKPSNGFGIGGVLGVLGLGAIAALVLGSVYAYLVLYNPFIYINFLATLAFGFGLGMATAMAASITKVRAPAVAALLGMAVGVFAVYVLWVVWCHGLLGRADRDGWILSPVVLWRFVGVVAEQGVWSLADWTPTGVVLWILWSVEAALIIGFPAVITWAGAAAPFCERCKEWTDSTTLWKGGPVLDPDQLVPLLEAGQINALADLGAPYEDHFSRAKVDACPKCTHTSFLTVEDVAFKRNNKGEPTETVTEVISNLTLTQERLDDLRALSDEPGTPAAEAQAAAPPA